MNPQIRFGEDLMSRVSYAMLNPGGAAAMTRAVRDALNALVAQAAAEARIDPELIFEAVIVGNPVMHHLVLGIDPTELGMAPFALATADALHLWAEEIELRLHPDARIYILPCIAGHVGADAAAVALSESPQPLRRADARRRRRHQRRDPARQHRPASSPAPPRPAPPSRARRISSGQRAAPGAIERVEIDPVTREPRFRVIGVNAWSDEPAFPPDTRVTGICGSGIIEAIAEMRLAGLLDASGLIGSRRADRQRPLRPPGPHPRLPPARRHPRHPGRRPRHPARASRRSTPARAC